MQYTFFSFLQLFHVCQDDGRMDSYFCPNLTTFNQRHLTCDWWFNVDCESSEQYYGDQRDFGVGHGGHGDRVGGAQGRDSPIVKHYPQIKKPVSTLPFVVKVKNYS
jgi:hypothetical protein